MDLNRDGIDDADQMERCVGVRAWGFLKCTWRTCVRAVTGLRTLTVSAIGLVVGFADELGEVDLQGWATKLFSDEQAIRVGKWLILGSIIMAVLRAVTKSPVGKAPVEGGSVDEPEA